MNDLELALGLFDGGRANAEGLGAMTLYREGLGAFEIGQTKYVTTKDEGRLGSLLIQPTSGDSGTASAIGYFAKNSPVTVSGQTAGNRTQVTGQAFTMDDAPAGALSGWVANAYLTDTQQGSPWSPGAALPELPPPPPPLVKPPVAAITAPGVDMTVPVLIIAGLLGAGAIGYAVYRARKKGHRRA